MRKFLTKVGQAAQKLVLTGMVAISTIAMSAPAMAVDTANIVAAFTDAATGVGAIAAVMLAVVAAGIAVKWILGFIIS